MDTCSSCTAVASVQHVAHADKERERTGHEGPTGCASALLTRHCSHRPQGPPALYRLHGSWLVTKGDVSPSIPISASS